MKEDRFNTRHQQPAKGHHTYATRAMMMKPIALVDPSHATESKKERNRRINNKARSKSSKVRTDKSS